MDRGVKIAVDDNLLPIIEKQYVWAQQRLQAYGINDITDTKTLANAFMEQAQIEESELGTNVIRTYSYNKETKKWDTSTGIVEDIAQHGNQFALTVLENLKLLLYMRQLNEISERKDENSFVHPKIATSSTNRVQYSKPGILTITKPLLWNIIRPTSDKYNIYSVDIQNQEPWILINLLKIDSLKAMLSISDSSVGLYEVIFNYLYHKNPDKIERRELKRAWNALTYGASKSAVLSMCKHIDGLVVYNFFKKIPNYQEYSSKMYAASHNMSKNTIKSYFGTDVRITGSTAAKRAKQMMNAGIQGTGADILAFLVEHFLKEVESEHLEDDLRLYFTRHDECIIEVSKDFEDKYTVDGVIDVLTDLFEHRIDDWEPFRVKVEKIESSQDALFAFADTDDDFGGDEDAV